MLKLFRRHLGLSQAEVADLLGTDQSTVCRIENGSGSNLKLEYIQLLYRRYDIPYEILMGDNKNIGPELARLAWIKEDK